MREEFIKLKMMLTLFVVSLATMASHAQAQRKNVLFLVADDMRPQLGAYEGPDYPSSVSPKMITPNLDALAKRSLLLKRAHVQQAICSPSRTSLLTGRRPDTTQVHDLNTYWRDTGGNFTTIPQYFKENGYYTVGMGKIFHPGFASDGDDPFSWTEPYWHAPAKNGFWGQFGSLQSWFSVNKSMIEEYGKLPDQQTGDRALEYLQKFSNASNQQPFFLAIGFYKPHLSFLVPEEFLDMYPKENISLPNNPYAPRNMPDIAWSNYGELRSYPDIAALNPSGKPNTTLPDDVVLALRRAYYAAISYTDDQIGRVLGELDRLGLRENTIISFWGDHGWQLGEHGSWCKHTNWDLSTHAPMMISAPRFTDNGIQTQKLTEFVDLFPTLVDLAELPPTPLCPQNSSDIKLCTEGVSLMPLIQNPEIQWKPRVFSQYPRNDVTVMGYTLRDERYRYTEWVGYDEDSYKPDWNDPRGQELYDHQNDPDENNNIVDDPDMAEKRRELSEQLRKGWRDALPPVYE